MNKKIIGIFVCMLLLLPILPSAVALSQNDDVKAKISAGRFGRNIGRKLRFNVVNNKDESVIIYFNVKSDYYYKNHLDEIWINNITLEANDEFIGIWGHPVGIIRLSISLEVDNIKIEREGVCIWHLVILF